MSAATSLTDLKLAQTPTIAVSLDDASITIGGDKIALETLTDAPPVHITVLSAKEVATSGDGESLVFYAPSAKSVILTSIETLSIGAPAVASLTVSEGTINLTINQLVLASSLNLPSTLDSLTLTQSVSLTTLTLPAGMSYINITESASLQNVTLGAVSIDMSYCIIECPLNQASVDGILESLDDALTNPSTCTISLGGSTPTNDVPAIGGGGNISTIHAMLLPASSEGFWVSPVWLNNQYSFWFNVDFSNSPPGDAPGILVEVTVGASNDASEVASALAIQIAGTGEWIANSVSEVVSYSLTAIGQTGTVSASQRSDNLFSLTDEYDGAPAYNAAKNSLIAKGAGVSTN